MAININPAHKGMLHREMGIKEGQKISVSDLMREKKKAKASGDTAPEKRVVFAENARKWHHGS